MREDEARAEYRALLPRLGEFRAALVAGLRRFETGGAVIKSRIKTWDSVRDKLAHSNAQRLADVQDLVGIRLVVPGVQAFLDTAEAIRRDFPFALYGAQHVGPGESAVHFAVRSASASPDGLSAEVQILTAAEEARRTLEHDLRYRVSIADSQIGASVEAATQALDDVVAQFETLIERPGVHEKRDVHGFLNSYDFLLFPNPDAVSSEVPIGLGTEYRIDFLVQKPDGSYLLVEIENPQAQLFTKAGDFAAGVNHALRQVEDWQEWIDANLQTVERYYPGMRAPEAWVIMGRDHASADPNKRRLARRNVNMRGRVAIRTYDDLLRDAKSYIRSIRRTSGRI
jgi:hypothetical protein